MQQLTMTFQEIVGVKLLDYHACVHSHITTVEQNPVGGKGDAELHFQGVVLPLLNICPLSIKLINTMLTFSI